MATLKRYTVVADKNQLNDYKPTNQKTISQSNEYIFDIVQLDETQLAVSSSDDLIRIFDIKTLSNTFTLKEHTSTITSLKSWKYNEQQILISSSKDGTINFWDLRASVTPVVKFRESGFQFSSFDCNCEGSVLAGGTNFNESLQQSKIVFWDLRSTNKLREFNESHNEDITNIRFHPTSSDRMLSGGMDGLVCTFALGGEDEDEALDKVINTGASVNKTNFFGKSNEYIYSMSHMETFGVWSHEGDSIHDFGNMKEASFRGFQMDYGITSLCDSSSGDLYYIAGSYCGTIGVYIVGDKGQLVLSEVLGGGHSGLVRSVVFDYRNMAYISGAEDGRVIQWNKVMPIQSSRNYLGQMSFFWKHSKTKSFTSIDIVSYQ